MPYGHDTFGRPQNSAVIIEVNTNVSIKMPTHSAAGFTCRTRLYTQPDKGYPFQIIVFNQS
jgi:hypothetical protein